MNSPHSPASRLWRSRLLPCCNLNRRFFRTREKGREKAAHAAVGQLMLQGTQSGGCCSQHRRCCRQQKSEWGGLGALPLSWTCSRDFIHIHALSGGIVIYAVFCLFTNFFLIIKQVIFFKNILFCIHGSGGLVHASVYLGKYTHTCT